MKLFTMKFRASMAMVVALVCGVVSSCQQDVFSVAFKSAGPGYVTVMATVPTPTEVAYIVETEPLATVDASLIYMTGSKMMFNADGEQQLLAEIEENTNYYVYLVARLSAAAYSEVYKFEFNSGTFTFSEMCSVVAVTGDGYKMRITVPESVKKSTPGTKGSRAIRYTQADLMFYNMQRASQDEYWMLLTNSGMYVTEDTTVEYSDALNVMQSTEDLNEDGVVNEEDLTYRWNPISPGEPVVFLAGEFEWMQLPPEYASGGALEEENYSVDGWVYPAGWEAGYYLPMIDGEAYDKYYGLSKSQTKGMNVITDIDLTQDIDAMWAPGSFQRKLFRTRIPDELNASVEMEVVELGPVDATLALTPDSSVQFYSVVILDDGTYGEMLDLLDGKEEYLQWATASFFSMYNFGSRVFYGPAEIVLSEHFYDVPADTKYHVLITGMGDETGSKQCFNHYTFNTPQKTKTKGPTIVVEALEDESSAFTAKFRIKCTSADNPVKKCFYGANYIKEWVYAVNSGGTYLSYGQQAQFTNTEVDQINSEAGLEVSFPTIDGETTRLVVVGYNDENTPNDVSSFEDITECPAVADLTTPFYEADICPSYYDMVDALAGDWVMSATVLDADGNKVPATKNVSILSKYDSYPQELSQEVYDIYSQHTKWTKDEIDGYWEEFKNNANAFNLKRLEYQNKLALVGWIDGGVDIAYQTMTPYDLFISETVSTVDVKSMFSDFGPKMFIEVNEEAGKPKLTITADMVYGLPVANWSDPFYMAGRLDASSNNTIFYYSDPVTGYYAAPLVFDVLYNEDFSELTIKAIETENGAKYYPNVIGQESMTGRYLLNIPIVSEVVLKKGTTAAQTALKAAKNVPVQSVNAELNISHKQYTRFDKPIKREKVKMEVMTQEKAHENYKKYIRLMENRAK